MKGKRPVEEVAVAELLHMAPEDAVGTLQPRDWEDWQYAKIQREFERTAEYAAWLAAYADARGGHGCGDPGHKKAVTMANKVARTVWLKAFGYADTFDRNPPAPKDGPKPATTEDDPDVAAIHRLTGATPKLLRALLRGFSDSWIHNAAHTQDVEKLRRICLEHSQWWNATALPTLTEIFDDSEKIMAAIVKAKA